MILFDKFLITPTWKIGFRVWRHTRKEKIVGYQTTGQKKLLMPLPGSYRRSHHHQFIRTNQSTYQNKKM